MLKLALKHNALLYRVPRYIATLSLLIKVMASALPCHIGHTNKLQNIQGFRQNKTYPVEQHCPSIDHIIPYMNKKAIALTEFVFGIIFNVQMVFKLGL